MTKKLVSMHPVGDTVKEVGSNFSQYQTDHSRKTPAFFVGKGRQGYQIKNKTDTDDLFQKLGKGRNGGFFTSDIISVDAGSDGTKRKY